MARITVEDCLDNVANRFELVMVASKRARQLEMDNSDPLVPWENDKATVVALREIAAGRIDARVLEDDYTPPTAEDVLTDEVVPVSGEETGEGV